MKMAADSTIKKVTLELGGKSPLVIFPDCDCKLSYSFFSFDHLKSLMPFYVLVVENFYNYILI